MHQLKKEKLNLEEKFDYRKRKLEKIKHELELLSKSGMPIIMSDMEVPLSPAEAQLCIQKNIDKYKWFKDTPLYEKEQSIISPLIYKRGKHLNPILGCCILLD